MEEWIQLYSNGLILSRITIHIKDRTVIVRHVKDLKMIVYETKDEAIISATALALQYRAIDESFDK
ncbi:MAG: hypothetical protein JJU16_05100 [Alkalibacterium sp.]|nr:hypothetical protein [Alkalibacterium sp.]